MTFVKTRGIGKRQYIEVFPETARDVAVLGRLHHEMKRPRRTDPDNPNDGPDPILVDVSVWERVAKAAGAFKKGMNERTTS